MEQKDLNEQGAEHSASHEHHATIFEKIAEKIHDAIENMDTDFPLSGGEEHPVHHKTEEKVEEKPHHKTSFLEDLDTDFPLSGGEVDH